MQVSDSSLTPDQSRPIATWSCQAPVLREVVGF